MGRLMYALLHRLLSVELWRILWCRRRRLRKLLYMWFAKTRFVHHSGLVVLLLLMLGLSVIACGFALWWRRFVFLCVVCSGRGDVGASRWGRVAVVLLLVAEEHIYYAGDYGSYHS